MTIEEAIEQLDWYFERDDGGAADAITKEAYYALKNLAQKSLLFMSILPVTRKGGHQRMKIDPNTEYILNDIAKMKAEGDYEMLVGMRDYWRGFEAGINTILEIIMRAKIDVLEPIKEELNAKVTSEEEMKNA